MVGAHESAAVVAAFLGAFVEGVETLTVVLAVGITRGWRSALSGVVLGIALLVIAVVAGGHLLTRIPVAVLQLVVGSLVFVFGIRWLRKAVLRAAGRIPLHDEVAIYARETSILTHDVRFHATSLLWSLDPVAVITTFKTVMLEGIEVAFIVTATGAGGMLRPASLGAALATALVIVFGAIVHRPLARIPENTLKFTVGVLLSAFGVFWVGEGLGIYWPGGEAALLGLVAVSFILAWLTAWGLRQAR